MIIKFSILPSILSSSCSVNSIQTLLKIYSKLLENETIIEKSTKIYQNILKNSLNKLIIELSKDIEDNFNIKFACAFLSSSSLSSTTNSSSSSFSASNTTVSPPPPSHFSDRILSCFRPRKIDPNLLNYSSSSSSSAAESIVPPITSTNSSIFVYEFIENGKKNGQNLINININSSIIKSIKFSFESYNNIINNNINLLEELSYYILLYYNISKEKS